MKTLTGLNVEIDIGESGDQRLLGQKYYGVILGDGQNADSAVEYAVVGLTTAIAYERDVRKVFVVPRHVGRGLTRLLAKFWRPKITVYVIPVGASDGDDPLSSWEAIRKHTIGIALMRRRASGE
jgi:hypothetical protein